MLYRRITEIKPNPQNPRTIKDDKFDKLVKSIKEFPQILPFSKIDEMGAGMYKGKKITLSERQNISDSSITANASVFHTEEEGQHHPIAQIKNPLKEVG